MITIDQLRALTALMAEDEALWALRVNADAHYIQQALRVLTQAIEGELDFTHAWNRLDDRADPHE